MQQPIAPCVQVHRQSFASIECVNINVKAQTLKQIIYFTNLGHIVHILHNNPQPIKCKRIFIFFAKVGM